MTEMLQPFSKIFHLGHRCLRGLFNGEVEITEKIDGSQFGFGRIGGELMCRSKGRMLDMDAPDNLFAEAVDQIKRIDPLIEEGYVFWGEYLKKRKHNTIEYDTYPRHHIALFGMNVINVANYSYNMATLQYWAETFGFDTVPLLERGILDTLDSDFVEDLLNRDSYLGGSKVEGFVVKNWGKAVEMYNQIWWPMSGKYVSERFKEKNQKVWNSRKPKGSWEAYKAGYCTEARWQKAIQHLRDNGELLGEPRDIGALIKEVQRDIAAEDQDEIKEQLWTIFKKDLFKRATQGLPEWYKEQLLKGEVEV